MVAPSFDYNPRRVKQFVNLFRLRALLASQNGLFGVARVRESFEPMTFAQLGKLVAIALRWPSLLADVEKRPALLGRLQALAWNESDSKEPSQDPNERYWIGKRDLMKLIEFPAGDGHEGESHQTGRDEYSLAQIDIERFLQVAPSVPGRGLVANQYEHSNHFERGSLRASSVSQRHPDSEDVGDPEPRT